MAASRYGRVKLGIAAGTAASLLAGAAYLQMGASGAASSAGNMVQADLLLSVAESPSTVTSTQASAPISASTANTATSAAPAVATAQPTTGTTTTTTTTSTTDAATRARTSRAS